MAEDTKTILDNLTKAKAAAEDLKKSSSIPAGQLDPYIKDLDKAIQSMNTTKQTIGSVGDTSSGVFKTATSVIGVFNNAILNAGTSGANVGKQLENTFSSLTSVLKSSGHDSMAGIVSGIEWAIDTADDMTAATRELKQSMLGIGNQYGVEFDQIMPRLQGYEEAVLLAKQYTYESIGTIQQAASEAAAYGLTIDQLTKEFDVAGTKQNILTEALLLAKDTGMREGEVFKLMSDATRKMGLSTEEAAKPLVALANLARETGLPIRELQNTVFNSAAEMGRLGVSVDNVSPLVRRLKDTLGEGFKGFAAKEATDLIDGLAGQINKANSAFIAMRGGLSQGQGGVAGAMLDFEAAFDKPEEIIKSLATTLGSITGGKIIKFEEARANPELSTQFKLQRDLLSQLSGVQGPQQTRTLMSMLADMQSGRSLSAEQGREVADMLKSGQSKEDETRTLMEKIGKVSTTWLAAIALNTARGVDNIISPQVSGNLARRTENVGVAGLEGLFKLSSDLTDKLLSAGEGSGIGDKIKSAFDSFQKFGLPGGGITAPNPARVVAPGELYERPRLTPNTTGKLPATAEGTERVVYQFVVNGTDKISRAIQEMLNESIKNAARGGGQKHE